MKRYQIVELNTEYNHAGSKAVQDVYEIAPKKRLEITDRLRKEMIEIYSGMNIY